MLSLSNLAKKAARALSDNSPLILTALGVTGTITTAYLTGKASFRAADMIAEAEIDSDRNYMNAREKVELTWKLYIPAATTGLLTVTCIIFANRIGTRRAAAMAAAFTISERAFEEYKSKVIEKLGEKKEQAVRDEIAQERVNRDPVDSRQVILAGGSVLCYDSYTGRYFLSDMETLRKAQNDVNEQITHDHYASLTDFYERIGLPATQVSEEVGWNLDKFLELHFSTTLSSKGEPCLVVSFEVSPARNYFRNL